MFFQGKKMIFTLIELLIAVAIIAILAGLLLPALSSARQKALETDCMGRKRQTAQIAILYSSDFDDIVLGPQIPSTHGAIIDSLTTIGYVKRNERPKLEHCTAARQHDKDCRSTDNSMHGPTTGFNTMFYKIGATSNLVFKLNRLSSPSIRPHIADTRGWASWGGSDGKYGYESISTIADDASHIGFRHGNVVSEEKNAAGKTTKVLGKGRAIFTFVDGHASGMTRAQTLVFPNNSPFRSPNNK